MKTKTLLFELTLKEKAFNFIILFLLLCYQSAHAQPRLADTLNLAIFNKTIEMTPNGIIYWKCDSLAPGELFTKYKGYTGLQSNDSMHHVKSWTDSVLHLNHFQYYQYYFGKRVEGAEYREHINVAGDGVLLSGGTVCENMSQLPIAYVTESEALTAALATVGAESYAWENDTLETLLKLDSVPGDTTYYPKGELVWALVGDSIAPGNYELAWKFDIFALTPRSHSLVYISAVTGIYLKQTNLISHSIGDFMNVNMSTVFDLDTRPYGSDHVLWTSTGGFRVKTKDTWFFLPWTEANLPSHSVNSWGTSHWAATMCHWAGTESWRMWRDKFHRNGSDDHGLEVRIYAEDPRNETASDGRMGHPDQIFISRHNNMVQGTIETVGHEFAHRVDNHTGNLPLEGEAGALEESYCDIMGLLAHRHFFGGVVNWKMYQLQSSAGPVDMTRDFEDPTNHFNGPCGNTPYPKVYKGANWATDMNDAGGCGIHTNCAVQNHCFYLLAHGGTESGIIVDGIGIEDAAKIAELAFTNFVFGDDLTFKQNRDHWVAAARILFGQCSFQAIQTCNAWKSVLVGGFCPCAPPPNQAIQCWPMTLIPEIHPPLPDNPASIKKEYLENKILIFPNPANGKVFINISELTASQKQKITSIQLIDIHGNVVKAINDHKENVIETPVKELAKGLYTVKIVIGSSVINSRLIIQ